MFIKIFKKHWTTTEIFQHVNLSNFLLISSNETKKVDQTAENSYTIKKKNDKN